MIDTAICLNSHVKKKILTAVATLVTVIYMFSVFVYCLSGILSIPYLSKVSSYIVEPCFIQNWAMFSNHPKSARKILVQYKIHHGNDIICTDWYNFSDPILNSNSIFYFSFNQRLIKYFTGTTNSIYQMYMDKGERFIDQSEGFFYLQAYAKRFFLANHDTTLYNSNHVKFKFKFIEHIIYDPNTKRGVNTVDIGYYEELKIDKFYPINIEAYL